jgi:phosphatidylglycerol:prolipoprotein diacylglycerol transferase
LFHVLFEAKGHILSDGNAAQGVSDLLTNDPFHWLYIDEPGFVLYGGLLTGSLVLLNYRDYANLLIWPVSIGIAIGRLDCFLNGCCYGIFGWPTQLAEALFVLLLGWRVCTLQGWILGYALWRFGIEFLRADTERGIWALGLSTSQWISVLILATIAFTLKFERYIKNTPLR